MFKNLENAKNLRWHAMDRKVDGIMRHLTDTPSWRLIDHIWPTFGSEPRNLRLGPKQPGYDINTYLAPLIDDLKILWEEGVQCFDAYKEEYFTLQAVLLWTINDFLAYESLKDFTSMRPIATACLDAYIMYLYTRMESSRTLNLYNFVDVGSISCGSSKEERAQLLTARLLGTDYDQLLLIPYNSGNHWTLVVINLTKDAAFWIDPLKNRIDLDVTEVAERSSHLYVYLQCPKQSGVVECGYYVMRFMRDIIMSTSTSIIQIMKDSPRAYTQDDIDCIRSEWTEFVGKHVHCA
ncbi:uncharacterized protein E6C27_scaffold89G004530 [Cucumis melo var. makuwa]|uniref:Ubiquitin-like protease family profile domain-containing protein n=1 Tax=Cucumis melo var. makuwa TaxID=1194695 RepID=A0A5A7V1M4_CUCMM|nr:uncharacterized protein E6C27_scaffold89G004530 [Cucumis melo var. makuwa]